MKVLEKRQDGGFNMTRWVRVVELGAGDALPPNATALDGNAPVMDWTLERDYVPYVPAAAGTPAEQNGAA